ncbi:GntR family transcriptional regulator [Paraliobacillus quinghaiensis]|uniref:GntR family transcriptional regulator n=1 Tax=Paraliobacillus quinghaiensis TaxID=470815 RepID=A0A917TQ83_9BACI|nr:GntR family transcriptional regulator [Paraliobacillus quinghaiensis]GGM32931.1 GntR family transcriptional regulator [Paraliobacillus quinghaiensis]
MNVNFNTRDPVYLQIIRYFKEQIANGELAPGEEIPSRRELANRLKINPNTAQRAYKEMEEQNLIHTERNHPSKITTDEKVLGKVREELLVEAVDTFVTSVRSINIPVEELLNLVRTKYTKSDNKED